MSAMDVSNLTRETLVKMFAENKRFDGRSLLEYREFNLNQGISNKAEGSARVKLGKTEILVGVKLGIGEPYPDSPNKGNLVVSADLLPLASPRFESGPPGFDAIELPRLIDREVRESGMIDLSKLVITPGEKVWTIYIDIYPINDDGNLIDAASLATLLALREATIPSLDDAGNIDYEKKAIKKLPLVKGVEPLSFSFFKLGNSIILDPTREEEEACEGRITFGISKKDSYLIHSCQKKDAATFNINEIKEIMNLIPKNFDYITDKLKKFL